jgi:peptidoglycan hydrolase CwlO-like protein
MKRNGKKAFFFILLFISCFVAVILPRQISAVSCTDSCSDQSSCEQVAAECSKQISTLQGQASTLKNQIAQFDAQIKLTTLKITQTQEQINMLGGRITQLGDSLTSLTAAFNSRAVETYKLSKFENNFFFILSASDIGEAVSRFHYLQKIQEEDQNLLKKLEEAQTTYEGQKADQEVLQEQLQKQKANLNSQKSSKNNLLTVTKNNEVKYQSLLSSANAQLAKFRNFAINRGGSSILSGQTKCNEGWTGCYYNQRDSEWGNMSLGGTSYLMKDSGCFVTSVAMLASHVGKDMKPGVIASLPAIFTSQGDLIWAPFNVNGTAVSISSDSKGTLDNYLSAGRPVIAKLSFSYGDHFIVILRKEGDNYIMNDPYLENGYNKPLSAGGYTTSDIVGLRLVSFN